MRRGKATLHTLKNSPIPSDHTLYESLSHPIHRQGGDPWAYGKAKQAVVVKHPNGKWYVSVFWEVPDAELEDNGQAVGLDLGKWNVATTEQERIFMPDVSRLETRLKRHQRKMQRRKRVPLLDADGEPRRTRQGKAIRVNSRRREKERRIVAKLYRRIAHIRDNWKPMSATIWRSDSGRSAWKA